MRRRNRNSGGHPRTPGRGGRAGLALVACGLAALATLSACGGGKASAQKNGTVEEQVGLDEDGIRVRQAGVESLHHVFSGPEALPSLAELDDPQGWLERIASPVSNP